MHTMGSEMIFEFSSDSYKEESKTPNHNLPNRNDLSDAVSTASGVSKQTNETVSVSTEASIKYDLLSPNSHSKRPKAKKTTLRLKALKPMVDVPPLDFGSTGLVGRSGEVATLRSCYKRLTESNRTKELVLVGGYSGVGKSRVIRSVEKMVCIGGAFVEGKFNMNTSNEPYSGVAKAFGAICQMIKEAGPETVSEIGQELRNELGDKPGMLVQLIPDIQDILAVNTETEKTMKSIDRANETEGGVDRLRFAFRVLMRVFSSVFSPLVLFLDDLQWADVSSLQVLEYLMSDTQNENRLMIIGSYRSEEVNENSLLYNKMVSLREKSERFHYHITEFKIAAFQVSDIEKIISRVLPSLRADHIIGLATLCHKRTLGNPFFTMQFIKMLHMKGMLSFDKNTQTWSWDLSEIREETMSTENVVVMLEQQLKKLPDQVQALLQCAAYLGSTFREPTIDLVWSVYGRRMVDTRTKRVASLLPLLVAENIFEEGANKQYRWCHDKLQEAALCLSGTLRETFQLDIGKTLYYGLDEEHVEEDLFAIVDLINNGNVLKRPEFVAVNLRAAEKARDISAFQSAADYAAEGIRLLDERGWQQHKSTALSLYTIGAESELILGNVDAAEQYREAVLSRPDLSIFEVLPLQIVKAKALGEVELKSKEALELCLKQLKNLGYRLTWIRPLALPHAAFAAIRMIVKTKAKPKSFFDSLEACNDTKLKFACYLISKAALNAYTAGDEAMYLLLAVKLVELTMEHGINEFSATAFTYLAVLSIVVLQDFEAMERFQTIALGILKKFSGMHVSETIFVGYQMGLFWVRPIDDGRAVAEKGILAGRREGDVLYTSWNTMLHVFYNPYTTGRPLHTILADCPNTLAEFEESKSTSHILCIKNYFQMLLNMTDPSCKDPSVHAGKIYADTMDDHKGNLVHLGDKIVAEGELMFWHEDYEITAKRALKVGEKYAKVGPAIYNNAIEAFHRAVALYAAAGKTRKRKYRVAANKIHKIISMWARYENTTIQYYDCFLRAEKLAFEKRYAEAKIAYKGALQAVGKRGHLHHLGLFNERYADFLLHCLSDTKQSKFRLKQAVGYYKEWGAVHKVSAMQSRLQSLKNVV